MPETNKHIGTRLAKQILEMSAQNKDITEIAAILGQPVGKVWCVVRGITWKGVSGKRRGKLYGEVTRAKAQQIIRLRTKFNVPISKLAESANLSETTVREILKGEWRAIWDKRMPMKGK